MKKDSALLLCVRVSCCQVLFMVMIQLLQNCSRWVAPEQCHDQCHRGWWSHVTSPGCTGLILAASLSQLSQLSHSLVSAIRKTWHKGAKGHYPAKQGCRDWWNLRFIQNILYKDRTIKNTHPFFLSQNILNYSLHQLSPGTGLSADWWLCVSVTRAVSVIWLRPDPGTPNIVTDVNKTDLRRDSSEP